MHLQSSAVVIDKAQPSEPVHEEIHSRAGGANQLCKRFLAYARDHFFGSAFLAKAGEYQKSSRQPLFA